VTELARRIERLEAATNEPEPGCLHCAARPAVILGGWPDNKPEPPNCPECGREWTRRVIEVVAWAW